MSITAQAEARLRFRPDIRNIICYKCGKRCHFSSSCMAERTNTRNKISTPKQESEAQRIGPTWKRCLRNYSTTHARVEETQDLVIEEEG
ncbi:2267_t:CDS:2, partial [Acaulospora morrowiae]